MSTGQINATSSFTQRLSSVTASTAQPALDGACWIYGAGGYGRLLHGLLTRQGVRVEGFIDQRAAGASGLPAPVIHPAQVAAAPAASLVIGVNNGGADLRPIAAWARQQAGFGRVLTQAVMPDIVGPEADGYWLTRRSFTADHAERIAEVAGMLADDASRDVLLALVRYRLTGDPDVHPDVDLAGLYFPADLPFHRQPLAVVDGGAYTGDLLDGAARANATITDWIAFEPDLANFGRLVAAARASDVPRVTLMPAGVGARCEQLRFAATGDSGARISDAGDTIVQIVAIDNVLPRLQANYVKLDIEGFERDALDGMKGFIARNQPNLAVSIYHKPQDLWELPSLVHDLLPTHRLHIRQHGHSCYDTVLYAVAA